MQIEGRRRGHHGEVWLCSPGRGPRRRHTWQSSEAHAMCSCSCIRWWMRGCCIVPEAASSSWEPPRAHKWTTPQSLPEILSLRESKSIKRSVLSSVLSPACCSYHANLWPKKHISSRFVPPAKWAKVSGTPAEVKVRLVYSYVPKYRVVPGTILVEQLKMGSVKTEQKYAPKFVEINWYMYWGSSRERKTYRNLSWLGRHHCTVLWRHPPRAGWCRRRGTCCGILVGWQMVVPVVESWQYPHCTCEPEYKVVKRERNPRKRNKCRWKGLANGCWIFWAWLWIRTIESEKTGHAVQYQCCLPLCFRFLE